MTKSNNCNRIGVNAMGIVTPVIQPGDDLLNIVTSSVLEAIGKEEIENGDIIGVTEAVLAISQGNFVTPENISESISQLYGKQLALIDPIQSRNRFLDVLKAIADTPTLEKIYLFMTYPSDEVGNHFFPDEELYEHNVSTQEIFSVDHFYDVFGVPKHQFTGMNYIDLYQQACQGKAEIVLCNNFSVIPDYCKEALICSIHRRNVTRRILQKYDMNSIYDLSEIMNAPVDGSGYSPEYGLYGTNKMANSLKLMPRNSQRFVEELQGAIFAETGKMVEVLVFGDGAFKDPVGGIWELADPVTTLAYTSGLIGTPEEVKLKYIMSQNAGKTSEEIDELVAKLKLSRKTSSNISEEASLGTTPRQITDLVASLCDLTVGSGDRKTPVVYIKGYLR